MLRQPSVYELILSLDKSELLRFGKFLRSPFFNHREDLPALFAVIAKRIYRNKPLPEKEQLFDAVYGEKPYDDVLLRAALSDLAERLESFLIWQQQNKDAISSDLALMDQLGSRNLWKRYAQCAGKTGGKLQASVIQNAEYHQKRLDYLLKTGQYLTRTTRTVELPLQEISDAFDTLYLAQKLRHACSLRSHQAVYRTQYDEGLLLFLLDRIEAHYLKTPAVALYYYCYRFLTEKEGLVFFQQFKSALLLYESRFPSSELKNLYLLASNFCIRKLNEGNIPFIEEGWLLYQEGLSRGFLIESGRISSFTFNNIVAFGIRLGRLGAVEDFILRHKRLLDPSQQQSFVDFNLARLEYTRKNLSKALELLQTADFKDLVNNLIAKTLLLKIYYELGEYEILASHIDSFRKFINRRELSDFHRKNYGNILTVVRKMISLSPQDKASRNALTQQVKEMAVLSEREWLLEML